jgi:hypothetical protein
VDERRARGRDATRTFDLAATGRRWYSLVVVASGAPSFRRTFAGHLENGAPTSPSTDATSSRAPSPSAPTARRRRRRANRLRRPRLRARVGVRLRGHRGRLAARSRHRDGHDGRPHRRRARRVRRRGLTDAAIAWTAPAAGTFSFDTAGSNRDNDTIVHVHRATCAGAELACNDNTSGTQSAARVTLAAGERVVVVVESRNPTLAWQLNARNVTVCPDRSAGVGDRARGLGAPRRRRRQPLRPLRPLGRDVSLQWTAPAAGTWRFDTAGSDFDTVLHVRTARAGRRARAATTTSAGAITRARST